MKLFRTALHAVALSIAVAAGSDTALGQPAAVPLSTAKLGDITLTSGSTIISVELSDNATSRDFLDRLPMTVTLTRSGEREYHGRRAGISTAGPKQTSFENGDFGYWAPGGYLAIFLDKTVKPQIEDLIVLGKVTSDLTAVKALGPVLELTIDRAKP